MYAGGLLSRFMHYCNISHFKFAKRVLRYIKGTTNFCVWFKKADALKLVVYTDSDWAGSVDDMISKVINLIKQAHACLDHKEMSKLLESSKKILKLFDQIKLKFDLFKLFTN